MEVNGLAIDDTFAEAFGMTATRLIVTARHLRWAHQAAELMTGFATSVIGCGIEAGIERELDPSQSPDGRPGVAVLMFAVSGKDLARQVQLRAGQCVLTAPTTALYAGLQGEPIDLGRSLRYFGDGFQSSKLIAGRRYWRIPRMDGEFLCEETTGRTKAAVGGGNFFVLGIDQERTLQACEAAVREMRRLPGVLLPFPGGIAASGSKIGSRYKGLSASTNEAYCPTLRGLTATRLTREIGAVLEIVIDGLTEDDVRQAMRVGIKSVCEAGANAGIRRITSGNYGGQLGQFQFPLRDLLP